MSMLEQVVRLDMKPQKNPPHVDCTQYDSGSDGWLIRAYLYDNGSAFVIPSDYTAKIEGTTKENTGFTFAASIVDNSNGVVTFNLIEDATAFKGSAWCKIVFVKGSSRIATSGFWLDNDRAGVEADTVIGAPGFEAQINQGVADYMAHHTVRAEDERLDSVVNFTEEIGRVPLFTNVIPISIDSGGAVFNTVGYQDGKRINSSGALVDAEDAFVTGFIQLPENPQNMVMRFSGIHLIASGGSTNSRIQFYDASFNSVTGSQTGQGTLVVAETDSDGYITRINFADQTTSQFIPTSAMKYVRFCAYGSGEGGIATINEEIAYDEHGEITSAALKPDVSIPQLAPLDARITALEEDEGGGTIDSTDPLVKYAKQIDNGLTVGYEPTLTGRPTANLVAKKYLNFLHISDTHGSANAENAVKILNKLKADGRCSFLIHTGDFHSSTFADVASWNTFAGYIAQATAPVLLVSGNHDVGNNSQSTTNGQTATDAQLYARCFEPYVSGWNLTSHPTGKCYWYKDFADDGVRLIGLYDFESDYATDSNGQLLYKRGYAAYHQAQIDWLVQALLTCPAGYGVIIAKHNPMNLRGDLDNPFNGEFLRGQNTSQTFVSKDMIAEIVQAFMDGTTINKTFAQTGNVTDTLTVNQDFSGKNTGAHFICYLDGHTHADGVNFLADFPNQLELNIGCDNYHYQHYSDTYNQQGTLHQDLLNYVSVDVNRGYVYIQRIGNDYTAQADRRDFTAIDYKHPPEAVDLDDLDARLDALESADDALETIADITFDGNTAFDISTDANGQAFHLKKAVLMVSNGAASANGNVMVQFRYANVFVYRAYASYSANQAGRVMFAKVWQENQRWYGEHLGFANNGYAALYMQTENLSNFIIRTVATYPYIDNVYTGWTPPEGTRAILLGVRA